MGLLQCGIQKGYIEDLRSAGIEDSSVDLVISNCVINLSPQKDKVFSEIWRVLKDGGVLYFSDIFADRKVPEEINTHPLLLGECLGAGFEDYTVISSSETPINNEEIERLVGDIRYTSDTIRAVKGEECKCCKFAVPFEGGDCGCGC